MSGRAIRRRLANRIFVGATALATLIALGALALILWSLLSQGLAGLSPAIFLADTPAPGSEGGLRNAIVGSLIMCASGMAIALVVGVLAGTWLSEYGRGSRYAQLVRFLNDVLLSAPSILIGLFVYQVLVAPFQGFSALAGAVALAFLATPVVVRTTEDILSLQPGALREAGMALGAAKAKVVRSIVWRGARAGLVTGGLLGFARISGETAPLLFTSLGNQYLSTDLTRPMAALPTTIFQFALSAYDNWRQLAWTGALLIAAAVLVINIAGRYLAREGNTA
jgi:phosphate transport system permease protein